MSVLRLGIEHGEPETIGAGFWIRALARLADWAYGYLMGAAAGIASVITLALLQRFSICEPGWARRMPHLLALLPASLLGVIFYHGICEGACGATLGKLTCGLRVLSEDRTPCSVRSAFIRSVAYFVDALFFGLIAYLSMNKTPLEQRHGDHWAGTIVVRRAQVPPESKPSGVMLAWAVVLGSFAYALPLWAAIVLIAFQ